jgi:hypothetical protein
VMPSPSSTTALRKIIGLSSPGKCSNMLFSRSTNGQVCDYYYCANALRYRGPQYMPDYCEKFRQIEMQILDMAFPDSLNFLVASSLSRNNNDRILGRSYFWRRTLLPRTAKTQRLLLLRLSLYREFVISELRISGAFLHGRSLSIYYTSAINAISSSDYQLISSSSDWRRWTSLRSILFALLGLLLLLKRLLTEL